MRRLSLFLLAGALYFLLPGCGMDLPQDVQLAYESLPDKVDFNQHIRPILSDRCWSCHGPDEGSRQAGLRLDTEMGAFAALENGKGHAFTPRKAGSSEALLRMLADDPEIAMPPPESKMSVSPKEIALVAKWIEQGAKWKDHWAFLPIAAPEPPPNPDGYAAANGIDHFINARLHQQNIASCGRAPNERLLRRLYLDLTGLPPSPEELDDWLRDPTDANYKRKVDELLSSDAHAERMSMEWLDLARYADSHGRHSDGLRLSWPYRDWVIDAFKQNMPFDAFVRQQVAGDLLPESDQGQKIASAFNRMHTMTAEGGVIGEEMRLSYVFDRVNTVATGLLGLTMDCSRCHDHKFDPISQSEYYGFSAFFNNFQELGMVDEDGNFGPYIMLAEDSIRQQLAKLENQLKELEAERASIAVSATELDAFLKTKTVAPPTANLHHPFDKLYIAYDQNGRKTKAVNWASESTRVIDDSIQGKVLEMDHGFDDLDFQDGIAQYRATDAFTVSLYINTTKADSTLKQELLGNSGVKNDVWQGMDFYLDEANRLNFRLVKALADDAIHIRSEAIIKTNRWYQVACTYDGSGRAAGMQLFADGQPLEQAIVLDNLRGEVYPKINYPWSKDQVVRKARLGKAYRNATGESGIFLGLMDELKLFDRALSPIEVALVFSEDAPVDRAAVEEHLRLNKPGYKTVLRRIQKVKSKELSIMDTLQRFMVSEERSTVRPTYRLDRGAYDAKREEVFATTPNEILPFPKSLPPNRLGLAEWIFFPENPLTARVAVNRYWQLIFGRGIVGTAHDFGSQGSLPSHPELLDYLATNFRKNGWDIKALIRQMVLSETYRRNSNATAEQREADPENRLLARGAAVRLPAEFIRDNALAASGLLVEQVGGPSVRPYQPPGLWSQSSNFSRLLLKYEPGTGDERYRRSMYTFIKRTSPPPFMTNFDASGREVCVVKRSTTNTPLQALNLLNDPQFVEAARVLAQRVQLEEKTPPAQLARAFRLVAGRTASPEEVAVLTQLYGKEIERFSNAPAMADSLLAIGAYPVPEQLDRVTTAALTSVGNVLFNFDEAFVKR